MRHRGLPVQAGRSRAGRRGSCWTCSRAWRGAARTRPAWRCTGPSRRIARRAGSGSRRRRPRGSHERRILAGLAVVGDVGTVERHAGLLRLELATVADPAASAPRSSAAREDVEIVSLGRHLELVKQVGHPDDLDDTFEIGSVRGQPRHRPHPAVDREPGRPDHSQPFWARGVADLATVHNGHITNYHKLRRRYEQRGVRFFSENDSEVIGVYLADQLDRWLHAWRRRSGVARRPRRQLHLPRRERRRDRLRPRSVRPQAADHRRDRRLRRDRQRGDRDPRRPRPGRRRPRAHRPRLPGLAARPRAGGGRRPPPELTAGHRATGGASRSTATGGRSARSTARSGRPSPTGRRRRREPGAGTTWASRC